MTDHEESLGDQNTFDGGEQSSDRADQSLGDEATFGGDAGSIDDVFDDDMEVVDLAARYTTEGVLGKGGMGEVLLATDTRLNRKVAIKRILGSAARSKAAVNRFMTEAQSIAALNHPNIVQIYDYGRAKDGPFLIMEYVEGRSLLDKCREGAVPLEEAIDLTCQLCDGLSKAHAANIVHRDIKPANVLLTEDGVPKLTDFGLAKDEAADTGMTMAGAVIGTLDFMPPEQRRNAALTDNRSDLWSLAATLYQMVTGEPPRVIDLDEVPSELRKCIAQALKSKKEDRYQTANELRDALKNCLAVPEPVVVAADNLGAGECPSCHTRNDSSRKFCSDCAKSLRANCLQCNHSVPVWDKICGECGGNQADLLEEKTAEYQKQKQQAEGLRGEQLFSDAIRISTQLSANEDERFVAFRDWGKSFADEVESEQERLSNEAHQHFEEAKKHHAAFDYSAAIHAMESIPVPLRSTEMQDHHAQLISDRDESQQVLVEIKEAITKRSFEGLLPKVERSLELRGDRQDLTKLQSQLVAREQKLEKQRNDAYSTAASLFELGDAKGAFSKINIVKTRNLRESDKQLKAKLIEVVKAEQSLKQLVADCKADGVIDPSDVAELLPVVLAYLKMNPKHAAIQDLQQDLLDRIQRDPRSHLEFLSPVVLAKLPSPVLAKLPGPVLAKLPVPALAKLPVPVLKELPAAILHRLPPITNSIGMKLKLLPSGRFQMGSRTASDETPQHEVTLTQSFQMGIHEVTQAQYEQVMGVNPSYYKGGDKPVDSVSWNDAMEFCRKLSALPAEQAAGRVYRLPTEAEWEYACRAGTTTNYSFGDDTELGDYAWFFENSDLTSHPVGGKKPNVWGLYDMHGNVWEWCLDRYGQYPSGTVTDPTGATSGSNRVLRGGSCYTSAKDCRSASRRSLVPSGPGSLVRSPSDRWIGFRVSLSPSGQ